MDMWISLYVLLVLIYKDVFSFELQENEFCIGETFSPRCDTHTVIVMKEAKFGRVRIGKCASRDYGLMGCYNDELQQADGMCSGRQTCSIIVPDMDMKSRLDCIEDLSPHLIATYSCQPVVSLNKQKCHSQELVQVGKVAKFLSSQVTLETSCGLLDTPWVLTAQSGQQIELTLTDFSWTNDSNTNCELNYGYVLDTETDDVINICGGGLRQRHLYLSQGNTVQIILQKHAVQNSNFLLKFKAVGCPEYKAPSHTWQEVHNNSLTVGCLTDSTTWKLTCVDHIWLGHVGNCSKVTTTTSTTARTTTADHKTPVDMGGVAYPAISRNHVIIFTVGCFTLLTCCCIIIVGIYYTKRCDMKIKHLKIKQPALPHGFGETVESRKSVLAVRSVPHNREEPPTYTLMKEQRAPPVPQRSSTYRGDMSESMMSDYLAPQGGDTDSNTYYILENPEEINIKNC